MLTPDLDFALARGLMVDGQLRPSRVTDRRILDAMRSLPRELFVPPALAKLAYMDDDLKLGGGRVLMKPLVLARLIQLARPRAGETALIVGAGVGYGAAVLASCSVQVTALEECEALVTMRAAAARIMPAGIVFVTGKLSAGVPDHAPYDLIIIEGAVRAIPAVLGRQVAQTGRLVTVLAPVGRASTAILAEPSVAGLRDRAEFDAATPLLPELVPAPVFAF